MTGRQVKPEVTELRRQLRAAGVSLQQIADRLGCSQPNVSQQFLGTRPMQPRTMIAAKAVLWERVQECTREASRLAGELQQKTLDQADAPPPTR